MLFFSLPFFSIRPRKRHFDFDFPDLAKGGGESVLILILVSALKLVASRVRHLLVSFGSAPFHNVFMYARHTIILEHVNWKS